MSLPAPGALLIAPHLIEGAGFSFSGRAALTPH